MNDNEVSPQKKRTITAHLLLSRAVIAQAPDYVTQALSTWVRELEGGGEVFSENIGVNDHVEMKMTNVKKGVKSDA